MDCCLESWSVQMEPRTVEGSHRVWFWRQTPARAHRKDFEGLTAVNRRGFLSATDAVLVCCGLICCWKQSRTNKQLLLFVSYETQSAAVLGNLWKMFICEVFLKIDVVGGNQWALIWEPQTGSETALRDGPTCCWFWCFHWFFNLI